MDLEALFVLLELNYLNHKKTSNVRMNVILKRVRVNTVTVEKAICVTYTECVFVALVIQHAKRVRRIIFFVSYHIFKRYLLTGTIFGEK